MSRAGPGVNVLLAVLAKDLRAEWRSRDRVVAMGVFALLVVLVYQLALPALPEAGRETLAAGLLWIAFAFAALLGMGRAFALELENEAIAGLALVPVDRGWIFLGKAAANVVLLLPVQVVTGVVFAAVLDLEVMRDAAAHLGVLALGAAGMGSLGTVFGAVAVRTAYREVLLPLLLLPLLLPVLVGAVRATGGLLAGEGAAPDAVRLLAVADGVYLILSFLLFEYVLDE